MPGKNPPYKTTNNLEFYLRKKQAERTLKGERILLKDIRQELATYCKIADITLSKIISKENQASLPVALKIVEYLQEPFEKVFYLEGEPEKE